MELPEQIEENDFELIARDSVYSRRTRTETFGSSVAIFFDSWEKRYCCDYKMKRFCCCMDIKSGSLAAGVFQVILVLFIIIRSIIIDTLWSLGFIVFPIINFVFFCLWVKKDTVVSRQ